MICLYITPVTRILHAIVQCMPEHSLCTRRDVGTAVLREISGHSTLPRYQNRMRIARTEIRKGM